MPNLTDLAAREALDAMGPLYVELHTANPTDTGTVGRSVAFPTRQLSALAPAAGRQRVSSQAIEWVDAAAAERITHASLWDSLNGGTCRWYGPLVAAADVAIGDAFEIAAAALTITVD